MKSPGSVPGKFRTTLMFLVTLRHWKGALLRDTYLHPSLGCVYVVCEVSTEAACCVHLAGFLHPRISCAGRLPETHEVWKPPGACVGLDEQDTMLGM